MENTSKKSARMLAALLSKHGVGDAVVSPGSRNAPLLVALERQVGIDTHVVIDERSAAFIALGMSTATRKPVALVCTSGTAPLNYAPAVAEAFYRQVPLIVITADRPEEWIDQDDSQTIVQPGIYSNFIKGTYDIPTDSEDAGRQWMIERKINEALLLAKTSPSGPVHINVRLDEPLGLLEDVEPEEFKAVRTVRAIGDTLRFENLCGNIMIVVGFNNDPSIDKVLNELSCRPNVVVLHEAQSNINGKEFIPNIDATLKQLGDSAPAPDIVISLGGSLTSRKIKSYLRGLRQLRHWSIGRRAVLTDCFRHIEQVIDSDAATALETIVGLLPSDGAASEFKQCWINASRKAMTGAIEFAKSAPWSDFKAMSFIIPSLPLGWNLQLSNGTAVRYTQLFDYGQLGPIHCNRGVSGIDGCTSTAIGFAAKSKEPTVLITGDMSMQYDIGALATTFITNDFKIIVLNNGGGGIFRFISSTRHLPELERCFAADVRLPLHELSKAYGFRYFRADDSESLRPQFEAMLKWSVTPCILDVATDGRISASVLSEYFK